jgi:acyl carrier protein
MSEMTSGTKQLLRQFAAIVSEVAQVPVDAVSPEKSFGDDLGIDSLALVECLTVAEQRLGVSIPDAALTNLRTVADAVASIESGVTR